MNYELRVRYFIADAGLMGKTEQIRLTKRTIDLEEFFAHLKRNHEDLNVVKMKESIIVLVNGKVLKPQQALSHGDEVSLLRILVGG
jgi:sulfur carrier protein ThiS